MFTDGKKAKNWSFIGSRWDSHGDASNCQEHIPLPMYLGGLWVQQTAAAGHHEQCSGQATKSACHLVKSLAGPLLSQGKVRTHTCSLCDAVNCHNSIAWLSAALLTIMRDSLPHQMLHGCLYCLLARGLDSVVEHMSFAFFS